MPSNTYTYQAPQSPSPSPSPSAAASIHLRDSPSPSPGNPSPSQIPWFVPGPSSRFNRHQRELSRPVHTRHKSNYVPQGPVLSTEARAHQRAQSYAGKSLFGAPSPTVSGSNDCGRSPLGRLSSFPGESDAPNPLAMSTASYDVPPRTPAKKDMHRRHSSIHQDSPFSDYFTDDARSLESQTTPTSETQHLLVRLNKLQSQLMRGDNAPEILNIFGRRIDEIESEVEGLHPHDCLPEEMEEELEDYFFTDLERDVVLSSRPGSKRQNQSSNPLGIHGVDGDEANWDKERQEKLLNEAQTALHFLTEAQEQLRQRHQELVNMNEEHSLDMEEKEMEVERLRSENESLKSDLGFDHSELLFLELQLKSLEVECEDPMYHPKLERLQRQMDNWRDDWRDVEARFKKRRARYGVAAQSDKTGRESNAGAEKEDDPQDWKVDIQKQGNRRVNSLTIRRVSRESESESEEQERKDKAKEEQPTPTKAHVADLESTPRPKSAGQQQQQEPKHQQQEEVNETPKTTNYTSQATQTTPPPSPTLTPVPLAEKLGLNGAFSPGVDECAITTSPSSVADSDEEGEGEGEDESRARTPVRDARTEQKRNALRELWSGLTDWAGMGDDDEW